MFDFQPIVSAAVLCARRISGCNGNADGCDTSYAFDYGRFVGTPVHLGELRADGKGRPFSSVVAVIPHRPPGTRTRPCRASATTLGGMTIPLMDRCMRAWC